jgi:hypothetical protein
LQRLESARHLHVRSILSRIEQRSAELRSEDGELAIDTSALCTRAFCSAKDENVQQPLSLLVLITHKPVLPARQASLPQDRTVDPSTLSRLASVAGGVKE